ncbi:unnamed protein product [Mycena citricolor]|uniref:Lariat debranching enzyme C-terminal domain-containing protein n=1 Tax=Mycena citricolor TaxID=2018698 RepID=A0AAD2H9X4_9AGAR|nr:unnamed protein product [Mycena citricolor]
MKILPAKPAITPPPLPAQPGGRSRTQMRVAIQGCCHGELNTIYEQISHLETTNAYKVDVLLICGDFQAIRNHQDLQCMAVPDKYKALGEFHQYYIGERQAPILTLVIGGNHEASNYMWELYHGGWLAPNMYYLGEAGCVRVNGLRIAGASGIFNRGSFKQGHYETVPYDRSSIRSVYHTREYAIRKLSLLSPHPDVVLSHDWPQSITDHGDLQRLLRDKSFFAEDIKTGRLGSPPLRHLLGTLQPRWWFSAHLHTRFEATVHHGGKPTQPVERDPNEIVIEDDEDEDEIDPLPAADPPPGEPSEAQPIPPPPRVTRFLALDKCGAKRKFLEVVKIEDTLQGPGPPRLTFDPEWLAISRAFHPLLSLDRQQPGFPSEELARKQVEEARAAIVAELAAREPGLSIDDLEVGSVQEFAMTAPGPGMEEQMGGRRSQPAWYTNAQTVKFCELIGVRNVVNSPPCSSVPA